MAFLKSSLAALADLDTVDRLSEGKVDLTYGRCVSIARSTSASSHHYIVHSTSSAENSSDSMNW